MIHTIIEQIFRKLPHTSEILDYNPKMAISFYSFSDYIFNKFNKKLIRCTIDFQNAFELREIRRKYLLTFFKSISN